jgi:hypothetical protein
MSLNTPTTNVRTGRAAVAALCASAAMSGISVGAHSVGKPSVTSSVTTCRSGCSSAHACACVRAPSSAGPVGVSPLGAWLSSDAMMAADRSGAALIATAGVE